MAWRQRERDTRLARTWMRSMLWHVECAELSSTVERLKNQHYNELSVVILLQIVWLLGGT